MSARQDGNFYCNITTFDHTKPYVRELWLNTLLNATKIGAVGGVFADHGWGTNIGKPNADGSATLCNGGGALRSCWNFTAEFSAEFNDAHRWVLNTSQDMLAKLPKKGPTVSDDTILSLSCYATDSGSRPFCHLRPQPQATLMSTGQRPVLPVGRPRGRSLRLRHHA